jgi:AhpC/TSA family
MSSLKDRLDGFKRTFEFGAPPYNVTPEIVAMMHRATAELKESGIEGRALKVGDRAPDFALLDQDQAAVSSKDLLRKGPMVISFFRGHW